MSRDGALVLDEHWEDVIASATAAPSLHNTQPWRFRVDGDALELHADVARHLRTTDPDMRQLHLSCGAALLGARLAVRALHRDVEVALLPNPASPTLLARLTVGEPATQTAQEARLARALSRRHTVRAGFDPSPVDPGLPARLHDAARREGGRLHVLQHPGHRRAVSDMVAAAERALRAYPEVRRELQEWTPDAEEGRSDGIPVWAYPPAAGWQAPDVLTSRDFDAGRLQGRLPVAHPAGPPALTAVLLTDTDTPHDWLRAGAALHAVLLTAAAEGVQASLHGQPLGLSGLRSLIAEEVQDGDPGSVQMLLQLGHAGRQPATPRRPAPEVLV